MRLFWKMLLFCSVMLAGRAARATDLTYRISSPLKPGGYGSCPSAATDVDGDCLDDAMEAQLAGLLSPYYFWDEQDGCDWYSMSDTDTNDGWSAGQSHDVPRYYYQVRPIRYSPAPPGYPVNISQWQPDGWYHWIRVTYFLNYPRDCGYPGHAGDNEAVYFDLYSADLQTWGVGSGFYPRHTDPVHVLSGSFLYNMATGSGGYYPVVMADDSGHGSWEGLSPTSTWCGPDSQGNWFSMNYYCLLGSSVINTIQLGNYVFPSTDKNIGEPTISGSDGRWNTNTLYVYTSAEGNVIAQSSETTGDYIYNGVTYPVGERWNDPAFSAGNYKKFCGWECPISLRNSNGDCTVSYHGTPANCTMPLYSKVATAAFYR